MTDVAAVLAKAAIFDFRTVGELDVIAWHEVIGDLSREDALAGVSRWYRDRQDRLMPAHLREAVALVQADRRRTLRLAAAEAAAEQARAAHEEPAGRFWGELEPEVQERLREVSGGLLGRDGLPSADEVRAERFFRPPVG